MSLDLAYFDAYCARLLAHDWQYQRSDDHRNFKAGQLTEQTLERESRADPVLGDLFQAFWASSGDGSRRTIPYELTRSEYAAMVRTRIAPPGTAAAPTERQQLARCIRSLAHALAHAAPDNTAPARAISMLQRMGLLEGALLPIPKETP